MAMRFKLLIPAPAGMLLAITGCAPVDSGFGEAQRYSTAMQTIDPDPVYPEDSLQPGYHGEKAQKATERYRKGQTKALRIESIGGVGGGGSGGGGGGSPGGSN